MKQNRVAIAIVTLCLVLLTSAVYAAKPAERDLVRGLPVWTDDSSVAVTCVPRQFSAANGSVLLTGRINHPFDVPVRLHWKMVLQAAGSESVRVFSGSRLFKPDETMAIEQRWDGRDAVGNPVQDGQYRVIFEGRMEPADKQGIPASEVALPRISRGETTDDRTDEVRARAMDIVNVNMKATASKLSPVPLSAPPIPPAFPYTFYFGTFHTQTRNTDGGFAPGAATGGLACASSTTHDAAQAAPFEAFAYAKGKLDFMAISDHNHQMGSGNATQTRLPSPLPAGYVPVNGVACDPYVACPAGNASRTYKNGLTEAAQATDATFIGIYGIEWGIISGGGHVNVFESPGLMSWQAPGGIPAYDYLTPINNYTNLYTVAKANPSPWGAFGQFNHPASDMTGPTVDFQNMAYTTDGDDLIHTIAVISGPATNTSLLSDVPGFRYSGFTGPTAPCTGPFGVAPGPCGASNPQYSWYCDRDMYNIALSTGYHVAPSADSDVHCSNYGNSNKDRTVVLIPTGTPYTKTALFDAIHNRRVYAVSSGGASIPQIVFTMTANSTVHYMGEGWLRTAPVAVSGALTFHTQVYDSSAYFVPTRIELREPIAGNTTGAATIAGSCATNPCDIVLTPTVGAHVYYVYVTKGALPTTDEIWSAPIWINESSCIPPGAPTALTATPGVNQVALSWTAPGGAPAAASYNIYRTTGATCTSTIVLATVTAPTTTYTDLTAVGGTQYSYNVSAVNVCEGVKSNCATATPLSCAVPPGVPGGVTAAATAPNQITVSWTASAPAATSYNISRSGGSCPGGVFAVIGTSATTSYIDNTATGTAAYSYTVQGVNGTCASAQSACASAIAYGDCLTAPTFAGLTSATAAGGGACTINLAWPAATPNCGTGVTYNIYRSTTTGFAPSAATRIFSGVSATSYADNSGLAGGTTYFYVVRAVDNNNSVEDANTVERNAVAPAACGSGPLAVQAFTGTGTGNSGATTGQSQLEWWNPASAPAGTTITINYRTDMYPTGPADALATVILSNRAVTPGAVDTFTHTGLTLGTTYYYAIWVRF
jgi:fibronectin type 3 domain-containing protein